MSEQNKKNPINLVIDYLNSQDVFQCNQSTYVKFTDNITDYSIVMPLDDPLTSDYILFKVHEIHNVIPTDKDISQAFKLAASRSRCEGNEQQVYIRFAHDNGHYYFDLANGKKQIVKITEFGWNIVRDTNIMFYQPQNMLELPEPLENHADPYELFNFVNVTEQQQQLQLLAFMTALLRPDIQRPILTLTGSAGSAKTTCARIIRLLFDPTDPLEVDVPSKDDEFALAFFMNQVPLFDNVGKFNQSMSNNFCKAVTGAAFTKRKLYSDLGQVSVSYKRPILTTSLNIPSERPDYHRRMLHIPLEPILRSNRRSERELMSRFMAKRSQILGSLLDLTCKALWELQSVKLDRSTSLPDFDLWGTAVAKALGKKADAFMEYRLQAVDSEDVKDHKLFALVNAVIQFAQTKPNWTGTMKELHEALDPYSNGAHAWPQNAVSLGKQRNELNSILDSYGCQICYVGKRDSKKIYSITSEAKKDTSAYDLMSTDLSEKDNNKVDEEDSANEIVAASRKLFSNAEPTDDSEEGYKSVFF